MPNTLYRSTRDVRLRDHAQIVLLSAAHRLAAPASVASMRVHKETVRTSGQPTKHYAIGAVADRLGETMVLFERRKRRREIAKLLTDLVER